MPLIGRPDRGKETKNKVQESGALTAIIPPTTMP